MSLSLRMFCVLTLQCRQRNCVYHTTGGCCINVVYTKKCNFRMKLHLVQGQLFIIRLQKCCISQSPKLDYRLLFIDIYRYNSNRIVHVNVNRQVVEHLFILYFYKQNECNAYLYMLGRRSIFKESSQHVTLMSFFSFCNVFLQ